MSKAESNKKKNSAKMKVPGEKSEGEPSRAFRMKEEKGANPVTFGKREKNAEAKGIIPGAN